MQIKSLSLCGRLDSSERNKKKKLETLLIDSTIGICKNNVCLWEAESECNVVQIDKARCIRVIELTCIGGSPGSESRFGEGNETHRRVVGSANEHELYVSYSHSLLSR
ncbi:hypothetical protein DPMN_126721 [Dreissena polymorpha]|uniref:Uncharacterized protein n=1 Tax=Dreissena polymorpha TaxID=45954 RepID=A0A9D4H3V9_DREPO|nr:hypothetical protein DPMN_126721 [Dreissena polymorpha]